LAEPTSEPPDDREVQEMVALTRIERQTSQRGGLLRLENGIFVLLGVAVLVVLTGLIWIARH
jgi:hypothetical protein